MGRSLIVTKKQFCSLGNKDAFAWVEKARNFYIQIFLTFIFTPSPKPWSIFINFIVIKFYLYLYIFLGI